MKDEIKSKFGNLLLRHQRELAGRNGSAQRRTAREEFEEKFRAAVDSIVLPAASEVKNQLHGWICNSERGADGLQATIEIFQGNMRGAGRSGRPQLSFVADAAVNSISIHMATQRLVGAVQKNLTVAQLTTDLVQKHILNFFRKLVEEGVRDH